MAFVVQDHHGSSAIHGTREVPYKVLPWHIIWGFPVLLLRVINEPQPSTTYPFNLMLVEDGSSTQGTPC